MVIITKTKSGFEVEGHAGYAPIGYDIVCAGISALTQAFIVSVEELTDCNIKYAVNSGNVNIEIKDNTEGVQLLVRSFFIGCQLIAEEFPDYVRCPRLEDIKS